MASAWRCCRAAGLGCWARLAWWPALGSLEQAAEAAAASPGSHCARPGSGSPGTACPPASARSRGDQLALRDEGLGGLAVHRAAVQHADGFEERPKIGGNVQKANFLLRILLTLQGRGPGS